MKKLLLSVFLLLPMLAHSNTQIYLKCPMYNAVMYDSGANTEVYIYDFDVVGYAVSSYIEGNEQSVVFKLPEFGGHTTLTFSKGGRKAKMDFVSEQYCHVTKSQ